MDKSSPHIDSVRSKHLVLQGFTLIELLVVISIISILVALLLPALSKARQRIMMLKCQTVVRSYGIANTAYMLDHKDYFYPAESAYYISGTNAYDNQRGNRAGTTFHYLLSQRYLDVRMKYQNDTPGAKITYLGSAMRCPTDTDDDIYVKANAPYNYNANLGMGSLVWQNPTTVPGGIYNWAGNWTIRNHGGTQHLRNIDSPNATPVLWDGRYANRGPIKGYHWGSSSLQAYNLRHFAMGLEELNVVFVDGHITSVKQDQWFDGKTITNF